MQKFKIRISHPADAKVLTKLICTAIRITNPRDYTPEVIEKTCLVFSEERLLETYPRRHIFVLTHKDEIIGTVGLGKGKLQTLFVAVAYQGQGLGKMLVAHLENFARTSGLTSLRVSSSITAKPFYEKLGYKTLHFDENDEGSTWAMEKQL